MAWLCAEKAEDDWVKRCSTMELEWTRPRGRPKKTWTDAVKDDMRRLGLATEDAQDRGKWRRMIGGKPANLGTPG